MIGISGKEVIRKPSPYGPCTDTDAEFQLLRKSVLRLQSDNETDFPEGGDSKYSRQQCRSACLQRRIFRECSCLDLRSRLPFPDIDGNLLCGTLIEEGMETLLDTEDDFALTCATEFEKLTSKRYESLKKTLRR